jgi:hypothetical protein
MMLNWCLSGEREREKGTEKIMVRGVAPIDLQLTVNLITETTTRKYC